VSASSAGPEHLTPHDLVSYSRCPFEMELQRARRSSLIHGAAVPVRTPVDVLPLPHSPLPPPPSAVLEVSEGPFDVQPSDLLVYRDEHEHGLPMLFAPERVCIDPRFVDHAATLLDDLHGLSGRPDLVIRRGARVLVPVEYKSTHLFVGFHSPHGRLFDVIQVIAECALVEAAFGESVPFGVALYGDLAGEGRREGWVKIPYDEPERRWLDMALRLVRADSSRPPVPSESHCGHCEGNRENLCRFASVPYSLGLPVSATGLSR
jgi:hypothetical protein